VLVVRASDRNVYMGSGQACQSISRWRDEAFGVKGRGKQQAGNGRTVRTGKQCGWVLLYSGGFTADV
jgi:hypothetical protein